MSLTFEQHASCFFNLLKSPQIEYFLRKDVCCAVADKYHMMTVLHYFIRAKFLPEDYTVKNFFVALYLSHDIYEEVEANKRKIIRACLGNDYTEKDLKDFSEYKFLLLQRMEYKVLVNRHICSHLFDAVPHNAWRRNRKKLHRGVIFNEKKRCKVCSCPRQSKYRIKEDADEEEV